VRLTIRGTYPPDWPAIAERVKSKAGYRCIRCGHPAERPSARVACDYGCRHREDGKQRILTVHHLDGDKGNCAWWNLLALCQVCHLYIQARVIPERPWLFDHSIWFRPYVAGFYASYYGGLAVTREEVMADMDRYLALGQPHLQERA
jgi:DNA-directed RNA polymerase subunit RPC12/RpoP